MAFLADRQNPSPLTEGLPPNLFQGLRDAEPSSDSFGALAYENFNYVWLVVSHIYFGRFVTSFMAVKSTKNHL